MIELSRIEVATTWGAIAVALRGEAETEIASKRPPPLLQFLYLARILAALLFNLFFLLKCRLDMKVEQMSLAKAVRKLIGNEHALRPVIMPEEPLHEHDGEENAETQQVQEQLPSREPIRIVGKDIPKQCIIAIVVHQLA